MGLMDELWPLHRSIAGPGLRETIRTVGRYLPIRMMEVPSGQAVLDWHVPAEWVLRRATLKDDRGQTWVDTERRDLHVLNYSRPLSMRGASLSDLQPILMSRADRPYWIPYRTSYYVPKSGLCMAHADRLKLPDATYDVEIDTQIVEGSLSIGECVFGGSSEEEILLSAHCCHPQLANDNLSSIEVARRVGEWLEGRGPRRYGYRLLLIPGTIGSITWLHERMMSERGRDGRPKVRGGLVMSCLGDRGGMCVKRPRRGGAIVETLVRAARAVGEPLRVRAWEPYGYDERQYNSPGFDFEMVNLSRTPNGMYDEYHTSADDLSFVDEAMIARSAGLVKAWIELIEDEGLPAREEPRRWSAGSWINQCPFGEPMLGRRGLYEGLAGGGGMPKLDLAMLWVLSLSDGTRAWDEMVGLSGLEASTMLRAREMLLEADLIREARTGETLLGIASEA
jgi:aminopeptidase-like protein